MSLKSIGMRNDITTAYVLQGWTYGEQLIGLPLAVSHLNLCISATTEHPGRVTEAA